MSNHLIFFGDSICVGQWVGIDKIWVSKVAISLASDYPSLDIQVHNRSINGNITRQALERMHFDCLSHFPQTVIIQFGLNDCHIWQTDMGHPRVSKAAYSANIFEMIDRCRHHGVKNIILNSNHPTTRTHTVLPNSLETYESRNIQYNEAVRLIGNNASDIHFFDVNKLFLENVDKTDLKNYLLEDEIHLSERGHEFYYVNFYKFLTQILETQMK